MIDVAKISYSLILLRPDGQRIDLQPFLRSLSWEENDGELAVRLEAKLQNTQMSDGKWLHQLIPLGGQIFLYADWGSGQQEIFRVPFLPGITGQIPWGILRLLLMTSSST